jgi:hypothetical protein
MELWFDAEGKEDVRRLTERVAYFATGSPPVRFVWGRSGSTGTSRRSRRRSTSSPTDGRALRAQLSLSLRGSASSGR